MVYNINMKNLKKSLKKGFTLIELLVVIAIIGLLSSIVLASLSSARQKAKNTAYLAEINQMSLAMQLYKNDNNSQSIVGRTNDSNIQSLTGLVTGGYIPKLPENSNVTSNVIYGVEFYGILTCDDTVTDISDIDSSKYDAILLLTGDSKFSIPGYSKSSRYCQEFGGCNIIDSEAYCVPLM